MFPTLERSFLALDWDPDLKKRYFDENAAEVSHYSLLLYLLITLFVTQFCCYQMFILSDNWLCTRKEKVCWF